jgi:hypothetical protein
MAKKTKTKNPAAVELGRLGGKARAKALTREQRQEIAKKALKAAKEARDKMTPAERTRIARKAARTRWANGAKKK